MAYGVSNGQVTDDVTWRKVLWGSTVGYPSDSLASWKRRNVSCKCCTLAS